MTYRERREHKAERLRDWADKREAKSTAAFERVDGIANMIPFGQPILVGHHSEGRARRDQDRISSGMRSGIDHADKAADFHRRADGIEAAAAHAIYSDDLDAVQRLRERIAGLEAERDRVKRYNASCRRGVRDLEILDDRQRAQLESVAKVAPYQLGKNGAAPAYWSANLSGNIGRQRKRLAELERRPNDLG
jgi:hypothetical protein